MKAAETSCKQVNARTCTHTHTHARTQTTNKHAWCHAVRSSGQREPHPITALPVSSAPPPAVTGQPADEWSREHDGSTWGDGVPGNRVGGAFLFVSSFFRTFFFTSFLRLQSFLAVVSQLCHACSSRIDWLQEEVSAHRSHVTALRSELQDVCLRDNLAFVPVRCRRWFISFYRRLINQTSGLSQNSENFI